jgi:hypothetical protein
VLETGDALALAEKKGKGKGDIPRLFSPPFALSYFDLRQASRSRMLGGMSHDLRTAREPLREQDIQGVKYFRKLWPLFERLHDVGCGRDKARNRKLHMDQYCALVLLFLFNPCVRTLRALQPASELRNLQRKLGCSRSSLGSLSEPTDVFDAKRLR